MKKSKLIALLNAVEGDPEIKLWNGLVRDWVDIDAKVIPMDLVRMTEAYFLESCRMEACIDRRDWDYQIPLDEVAEIKKDYKKNNRWEDNPYVTQEDIDNKRYAVKTVHVIQAKHKGECHIDRMGEIEY